MALYAAYAFNEGSGTVITDHSGNGRNLTVSGTPAWPAGHGSYATCFQSDATGSGGAWYNAGSPLSSLSGAATVMCWYQNRVGSNAEEFIGGLYAGAGSARMSLYGYRSLFGTSGAPEATIRDSASNVDSVGANGNSDSGVWHHAAVTFDTVNNVILYLDGVQVATFTTAASGGLGNFVQYIGVGSFLSGGTQQCYVQDMRVFDTALAASDVVTYMNTPVAQPGVVMQTAALTLAAPAGSAGSGGGSSNGAASGALAQISLAALAGSASGTQTGAAQLTTALLGLAGLPGSASGTRSGSAQGLVASIALAAPVGSAGAFVVAALDPFRLAGGADSARFGGLVWGTNMQDGSGSGFGGTVT